MLGLAGAIALTSAGQRSAAYTTPSFSSATPARRVTINFTQSATDDPSAKLTFYAPREYSASLDPGRRARRSGPSTRQGTAADLGGAVLPLTGTVQVRAAAGTYLSGTTQVPIAAASTQCTGTATHTAFWVLILQAAGQTLELPVFVDQVTAPLPGARARSPRRRSRRACRRRRAGRDAGPRDVRLQADPVNFKVNDVFTSAGTGEPRWRVLATPYRPDTRPPNAAGSVEAQSVVAFPRSVVLTRPTVRPRSGVATLRDPRATCSRRTGRDDAAPLPRHAALPRPRARSRCSARARGTPARSGSGRRRSARSST